MPDRTRFLARLIGLYCLLAALLMTAQREAMIAAVGALTQSAPLLLLLAMILVAAGLALVLAHNLWSGGLLALVVTVIGWLTLLKGVLLWALPGAAAAQLYLGTLHYAQRYYLYCAVSLALGAYLTAAGFTRRRSPAR